MLTYQEAYDLTSSDLNDEQRKSAALALQAGSAANEVYWNHTDTVTRLTARAEGHGAPPPANPDERVGGKEQPQTADAEATAVEEPTTAAGLTAPDVTAANDTAEVARLRQVLADHGINPDEPQE